MCLLLMVSMTPGLFRCIYVVRMLVLTEACVRSLFYLRLTGVVLVLFRLMQCRAFVSSVVMSVRVIRVVSPFVSTFREWLMIMHRCMTRLFILFPVLVEAALSEVNVVDVTLLFQLCTFVSMCSTLVRMVRLVPALTICLVTRPVVQCLPFTVTGRFMRCRTLQLPTVLLNVTILSVLMFRRFTTRRTFDVPSMFTRTMLTYPEFDGVNMN